MDMMKYISIYLSEHGTIDIDTYDKICDIVYEYRKPLSEIEPREGDSVKDKYYHAKVDSMIGASEEKTECEKLLKEMDHIISDYYFKGEGRELVKDWWMSDVSVDMSREQVKALYDDRSHFVYNLAYTYLDKCVRNYTLLDEADAKWILNMLRNKKYDHKFLRKFTEIKAIDKERHADVLQSIKEKINNLIDKSAKKGGSQKPLPKPAYNN